MEAARAPRKAFIFLSPGMSTALLCGLSRIVHQRVLSIQHPRIAVTKASEQAYNEAREAGIVL
jgi:hypothetical protein